MSNNNRIKVLMFGWEFPPFNSGGLGVACLGLTKALTEENIDITFILPRKLDIASDFMRIIFAADIPGVHIRFKSAITYTIPSLYNKKPGEYISQFHSLLEEVQQYGILAKEIAMEEDFDVIHAHDWLTFPAALVAKAISGKPLVVHMHATEFDRTGNHSANQDVYAIEQEGMKLADYIIAVSNFTKNIIVDNYNVDPSKIVVVHNGVEDAENNSLHDEIIALRKHNKIVLFVGRLTLQKGPDYFIKTAQKVLQYDPKVVFVVVGSGDMKEKLIRETVSLGLSEKIIFAGFLRDEQLRSLYKSADLFVMPSVSEPFGITGLESAINGTPVLISKQSGVAEVLQHALKVDFWDTDEMTNKILAVLKNPSLKKTLKKNGYTEAKTRTWHQAAKKVKDIYTSLVKGKKE